ncbi:phosphoribulokinase [Hydrogenovibrio sp. SC-1]|uniref:phosphoribulokinase n=1 Tax=Hydrogenovibrio sp. SC-1 TaxID=2065820 RepID=UPI000C797A7C|nr:phosphoribulokinase [Hydrogenovibrio sp. SC-1]PLA74595.1 phosphoribulokinase [Hydrogenovibrio sp. SC-1]
MSVEHPIVTVTGSSGAGTSFVKRAVEKIFDRENLNVAIVEGDSYHKYCRTDMKQKVAESKANGGPVLTHFAEAANEFAELEALFKEYKENATGKRRYYIHSEEEATEHNARLGTNLSPGEFTPWEAIPEGTDVLFYEGLHGMVKRMDHGPEEGMHNVAQYVDLGIGVAPCVNIEWMQKIYRDTSERPYSVQQVHDIILERMPDYIETIVPQFHRTHINFHRVPLIDTSDPFSTMSPDAPMGPAPEDSLLICHIRHQDINLEAVKDQIEGAFLQNEETLVCGGQHMVQAMDLMMTPIIQNLIAKKRAAIARLAQS